MTCAEKLIHKALAVEAVNKTLFLSHLEHQGKTLAGKSDVNLCHFSPFLSLKGLSEPLTSAHGGWMRNTPDSRFLTP